MKTVLVLIGCFVAQVIAEVVFLLIAAVVMSTTDMESLVAATAGIMPLISAVAGLPMMLILRGRRLLTTDISHVNEKMRVTDFLTVFILVIAVQALATFGAMLVEPLLNQIGASLINSYADAIDPMISLVGIPYVVIIGPIIEEIMFRGAVMRSLERFGTNYAIVMSSLLFGLYHVFIYQVFYAALAGIVFAYVAARYSLKWSILLHQLTNLLSVVISLASAASEQSAMIATMITLLIYLAALVSSIVILAVNRKRLRAFTQTRKPSSMFYLLGVIWQSVPNAASDQAAMYYPQVIDVEQTGLILPSAGPDEQKPHPFLVTFTSVALMALMSVVLFAGVSLMFG
jgi:membrane protease YdiL (CAAX protease family)